MTIFIKDMQNPTEDAVASLALAMAGLGLGHILLDIISNNVVQVIAILVPTISTLVITFGGMWYKHKLEKKDRMDDDRRNRNKNNPNS